MAIQSTYLRGIIGATQRGKRVKTRIIIIAIVLRLLTPLEIALMNARIWLSKESRK